MQHCLEIISRVSEALLRFQAFGPDLLCCMFLGMLQQQTHKEVAAPVPITMMIVVLPSYYYLSYLRMARTDTKRNAFRIPLRHNIYCVCMYLGNFFQGVFDFIICTITFFYYLYISFSLLSVRVFFLSGSRHYILGYRPSFILVYFLCLCIS